MRKRTALAQTLILDPDIILMDEPFSALDIQTRQLMENELLDLWAGQAARRCCSSPTTWTKPSPCPTGWWCCRPGPATRPIGEFDDRPAAPARRVRDRAWHPRFVDLHTQIWAVMREEVLKGTPSSSRRPPDMWARPEAVCDLPALVAAGRRCWSAGTW
jgi:NitT/TauT family transport system ATP-binding protein